MERGGAADGEPTRKTSRQAGDLSRRDPGPVSELYI